MDVGWQKQSVNCSVHDACTHVAWSTVELGMYISKGGNGLNLLELWELLEWIEIPWNGE